MDNKHWRTRLARAAGIAAAALLLSATTARAQKAETAERAGTVGQGYVTGGFGGYVDRYGAGWPVYQFGGGAEALIERRLGIGAGIDLLGSGAYFSPTLSITSRVYFPRSSATRAPVPFVLGGYTRFNVLLGSDASNATHVGAGLAWWHGDGHGATLEFRDVLYQDRGLGQYWSVRVGYTFGHR